AATWVVGHGAGFGGYGRGKPPRRGRPRPRHAAEQRDELAAAAHSITSSARASSVGDTSRPSAFAVLRLITNWNLVGCTTGISAGLVAFRKKTPLVPALP